MALVQYLTTNINNKPIWFELLYGCMTLCGYLFVCWLPRAPSIYEHAFCFEKYIRIVALNLFWRLGDYLPLRGDGDQLLIQKSRTKLCIFYIILSSIWITWNSFWIIPVSLLSYFRSLWKFDRLPILVGDGDRKAGDGDPKTRI